MKWLSTWQWTLKQKNKLLFCYLVFIVYYIVQIVIQKNYLLIESSTVYLLMTILIDSYSFSQWCWVWIFLCMFVFSLFCNEFHRVWILFQCNSSVTVHQPSDQRTDQFTECHLRSLFRGSKYLIIRFYKINNNKSKISTRIIFTVLSEMNFMLYNRPNI